MQMAVVASMMRLGRAPNEGWLEWFCRTRVRAREFLRQGGFTQWSHVWYHEYFKLVQRARNRPDSLLCRVLCWRDLRWWEGERLAPSNHRPHANRHPRRFVPRRWEARAEALSCWAVNFPLTQHWWDLPSGAGKKFLLSFISRHAGLLCTAGTRRFVGRLPM